MLYVVLRKLGLVVGSMLVCCGCQQAAPPSSYRTAAQRYVVLDTPIESAITSDANQSRPSTGRQDQPTSDEVGNIVPASGGPPSREMHHSERESQLDEDEDELSQLKSLAKILQDENQSLRREMDSLKQTLESSSSRHGASVSDVRVDIASDDQQDTKSDHPVGQDFNNNGVTNDSRNSIVNSDSSSLMPHKRPRREIVGTTATVEGARLFGDRLMMKLIPNAQRIPKGHFFPAEFDAHLVATSLKVGDLFSVSVAHDVDQATFGPLQEGAMINNAGYFECKVEQVEQANTANRNGCIFSVQYYVVPHPNGENDLEMAIPIKAVLVSQPTNNQLDPKEKSDEFARIAASIGQLSGGVENYFNFDAAATLLSKFGVDAIGQDQSNLCAFSGEVKKFTPCFVRITDDAVF